MNNKHIYIDDNIVLLDQVMKDCGDIKTFQGRSLDKAELIKDHCAELITRSTTKANEHLLDGTQVKFVATATAGTDHFDKKYLEKNDITYASAPGSNANSVAEYVVYSILKWANTYDKDVKGLTIGIIGYGNIGKIVAKYCHYMGLQVLINDPFLKDEHFQFPEYVSYASVEDICRSSDILTNHVPLTKSGAYPTENLLNKDNLQLLKNGAFLVHASRGGVVEEMYVIERLKGQTMTACIDVWAGEPLFNHELAALTMLSSQHVAGHAYDGKLKGTWAVAKAYEAFTGIKPDYSILDKELESYTPAQPEDFADTNQIYNTLKRQRLFEEDTERFLQIIDMPRAEQAKQFDVLRKQYPKRRESL